ncbi:MAG: DUF87 domain-containing protein [Desulfobulbaceae bacterium]|nr:DUF87 domain-containing protein [Desulfobulbaceae bacterium]
MSDSSIFEKMDLFYLGREIDPDSGVTSSIPLLFKNKNLTTHAAIIGMTGSGKTGLGIGLLEEAALDRLPAIVIDPKGDMGNLMLTFPEMRSDDFMPWVDSVKAEQKKMTREELARQTAETWEKGIESWGQDRERIARLRENVDMAIYTPGSNAGRAVSILDSLDAPEPSVVEDNDTVSSLVNSSVSSILGLIGVQADPLKSREHILLSSILLYHWRKQNNLSLETLIGNVVNPPLDRIGVFPLESFYPQSKRMELAMQLNNIIASPSFSGWTQGDPLIIERFLYTESGLPRIAIFSIAHLSESERMFFVTMLLGKLINWMRRQEGSSGLRCLLYMDEIFGYFPPLANPPSKKPMLLLLKQARAYGLGVVLATQNPVDLDYKGLSNIGTWFIGRMQTRQDQDRVISGISSSTGKFDIAKIRQLLANLKSRTFLMTSAHLDEPVLFETRWVLSYLKGPISLNEVSRLNSSHAGVAGSEMLKKHQIEPVAFKNNTFTDIPPILPDTVEQCFVQPSVPIDELKFIPWLAGSASVRFYNQSRGIDIVNKVNIRHSLADAPDIDWDRAVDNPVSPDDTLPSPPPVAQFMILPGAFSTSGSIREYDNRLSDYLYHNRQLQLIRVPSLKLESQPGELESQFQKRLADILRDRKEAEMKNIEDRFKSRQLALERRLANALDKIEKEKSDVTAKGMDTALSFGIAVFGALFGRKAISMSTANRSAQGVRSAGRLMKEKEDVRRAEEEAQRIEADIAALAVEFQEMTAELAGRFSPENFPAENFSIKPRRADIFDVKVFIQWEPMLDFRGLS